MSSESYSRNDEVRVTNESQRKLLVQEGHFHRAGDLPVPFSVHLLFSHLHFKVLVDVESGGTLMNGGLGRRILRFRVIIADIFIDKV